MFEPFSVVIVEEKKNRWYSPSGGVIMGEMDEEVEFEDRIDPVRASLYFVSHLS